MKRTSNYVKESLSFEDFEQAVAQLSNHDLALDELVRERLLAEKESRQKEKELKKARRK